MSCDFPRLINVPTRTIFVKEEFPLVNELLDGTTYADWNTVMWWLGYSASKNHPNGEKKNQCSWRKLSTGSNQEDDFK